MWTLQAMKDLVMGKEPVNQSNALTAELPDNIIVDTAYATDTEAWETGIKRSNIKAEWVIVQQYPNKAKAKRGHTKWVELLTHDPTMPLKDIDLWGLGLEEGE